MLFFGFSCSNDDTTSPSFDKIQIDKSKDFLVFGSIYGECEDDCRTLFLLSGGRLYEDAGENTELQWTVFKQTPLPLDKYYLAQDLERVPGYITNLSYSESDFVDYIADFDYYIYGQREGVEFEMIYDAIENASSSELRNYAAQVQEVLSEL